MSLISKIKNKEKIFVLIDINSSSVGGLVFTIEKGGKPKILFSIRDFLKIENDFNKEEFLNITIKSLKNVVSKICMQGVGNIEEFYCFLSSPWFHSQTRLIKLSKNVPFVFTNELASSLVDKEISQIKEDYIKNNEYNFGNIITTENRIMSVSLNGYKVKNPYKQKAKRLEISLFVSLAEEEFLKNIEEAISQHFHFKKINFNSFLIPSFIVSSDMFIKEDSFLLLNIGGEITDISMVKKNIIKDSISFPLGYNNIIRNLSKELNYTIDEAKSFISLYKNNHISDNNIKNIEEFTKKAKKEWLYTFQQSLNILSNDISIPATIFINIDENFEEFFADIIKEEQLNQYTLTESNFKIIFLNTEFLHGIVSFLDDSIKKDSLLIIGSLYISNLLNKK